MAPKPGGRSGRSFRSIEECFAAVGPLEEAEAATRAACSPDLELFVPLGLPRKGDWLKEHKEVGQTYTTYQRRMKPPMTPSRSACESNKESRSLRQAHGYHFTGAFRQLLGWRGSILLALPAGILPMLLLRDAGGIV